MALRIGLLLLIVPGVVMMALYMNEMSAATSCTEAGGSYDYLLGLCDHQARHSVVPFMARYPLLVNGGMLLSVVGLFFCLAGLYTRR